MKEESEESWIKHGYLGYCMNFESIYTGVIVWCITSNLFTTLTISYNIISWS